MQHPAAASWGPGPAAGGPGNQQQQQQQQQQTVHLPNAGLDDAAKARLLYDCNHHLVLNPWPACRAAKKSKGANQAAAEFERSVSASGGLGQVTVHSQLPTAAEGVLDVGLLFSGSSSGFEPYVLLAPHGSKEANGALRKQPKKTEQHKQGKAAIEYASFNSINSTYKLKPVEGAQGFPAGVTPSIIRNLSTCRVIFPPPPDSSSNRQSAQSAQAAAAGGSNRAPPSVLTRVNRVFLVVSDLPEDVKEALRQQKQQKQQQQQQALLPWVEQSAFVPGRSGYVGAIALYEFVGQTEEQLVLGRQALSIHLPTAPHGGAAAAAAAAGSNSGFVPNPEMHQILDMLAVDADIAEVLGADPAAAHTAAVSLPPAAAAHTAAVSLAPAAAAAPPPPPPQAADTLQAAAAAAAAEAEAAAAAAAAAAVARAHSTGFPPIPNSLAQQNVLTLPPLPAVSQVHHLDPISSAVTWQAQQMQQLQQQLQQLQLPPNSRPQKQQQVSTLRGLLHTPQLQVQQIQQAVQHKVLQEPCRQLQWRLQVSRQLSACSEVLKVLLLSVCAGLHAGHSEQLWLQLLLQIERHNAAVAAAEVDGLSGADRYIIPDVLLLRNDVGSRTLLHMLVSDYPNMLLLPEGCQQLQGLQGEDLEVRDRQSLVQYLQANTAAATAAGPDSQPHTSVAAAASAAAAGAGEVSLGRFLQAATASAANSSSSSGSSSSGGGGGGGSVLPPTERVRLLQLLRARALGPDSSGRTRWQCVLSAVNKNGDTAWLTACHWCIPEVLTFLLADPDFDLQQHMLATTKKHRLFYHKICREAAERAQHGQDTARHLQALHTTLAALTDRVLAQKCAAAGVAAAAAVMQAVAAVRQQRQLGGVNGQLSGGSAVSLPQKRRHDDDSPWPWQQQEQQQQQEAGIDPVAAAGYSSSAAAAAPGGGRGGEHGACAGGRWLQEVSQVVSADVVLQVLHDLQHKHIYHTSVAERTYDAAALDAAVLDLFGFEIASV